MNNKCEKLIKFEFALIYQQITQSNLHCVHPKAKNYQQYISDIPCYICKKDRETNNTNFNPVYTNIKFKTPNPVLISHGRTQQNQ